MTVNLKRLQDQVIVITGASSGIGLATAKMAAERGARVVLCSRNGDELETICREINAKLSGSKARGATGKARAIGMACDVANPDSVQRVADRALAEFGAIDTWVNNAGITIYGKLWEVSLAEKRRLFDVNFWGVVHGCRSALKVMRDRGGAIINIGSVLSERSIPIQGIYTASKHAVKAYTDALRMEVEAERIPVSVTLIKPGAIDTPYTEHAVNHMQNNPKHVAPVYAPEVVARAILECAENPKRDVFIGGSAKFYSLLETFLPRLTDLFMEKTMMESGQSSEKVNKYGQDPALFKPSTKVGRERGNYEGVVFEHSAFTASSLRPGAVALIASGVGLLAAAAIGYFQGPRRFDYSEGDSIYEPASPEAMSAGTAVRAPSIYEGDSLIVSSASLVDQ